MSPSRDSLKGQDLFEKSGVKTSFWDYLSLLSGNLLLVPIGIVSVVLTTRILGTEGYGYITVFGLVSQLVMMLSANWTAASLMRFGREEYDREGKVNETFWARTVILLPCLLMGVGILFLCRKLVVHYMTMPGWVLWLVVGSVGLITGRTTLEYVLQAIHRMKAYAAIQIVFASVSIVGLALIFAGLFPKTYLSVILVGLIIQGMTLLLLSLLLLPGRILLPVRVNRNSLKEVLSFSYPILFGNLAAYVVNWIDVLVIKHYFSMSDVGGYQLAYNLFGLLGGMMGSMNVLMVPILVSLLAVEREDLISRYSFRLVPQGFLAWTTLIGLVLGICVPVFRMMFGDEFAVSADYFQFLAVGLAISGLIHFYSGEITAFKLMKLGMVASIARGITNLVGDLILVPKIGPLGASLATTGGVVVAAVLYLHICQRQIKQRLWWQFFLVVPTLLSFVISRTFFGLEGNALAIVITLASSFYLAKALRLFSQEDLILLNHIQIPSGLKRVVIWAYPFLVSNSKP